MLVIMNFKTSEKGSIIIVVSVMVAIILVMLFVIIYENNKEKNQPKQEKIQKEIKINKNIENDENLNTDLFKNKKSDLGLADRVLEIKYQYFGDLVSIFDDKKINNITLRGDLNGGVKVSYLDNSYLLIASFKNLPDLKNNSFYNGWLVKEGGNSLSIINTGKAIAPPPSLVAPAINDPNIMVTVTCQYFSITKKLPGYVTIAQPAQITSANKIFTRYVGKVFVSIMATILLYL